MKPLKNLQFLIPRFSHFLFFQLLSLNRCGFYLRSHKTFLEDLPFVFQFASKPCKRRESGKRNFMMLEFSPLETLKKRWVFDFEVAAMPKTLKNHWFFNVFEAFWKLIEAHNEVITMMSLIKII